MKPRRHCNRWNRKKRCFRRISARARAIHKWKFTHLRGCAAGKNVDAIAHNFAHAECFSCANVEPQNANRKKKTGPDRLA
jgi:hypothetical protein